MNEGRQVKVGALIPDHNIRLMEDGGKQDSVANSDTNANTAAITALQTDVQTINNTLHDVSVLYGKTGTVTITDTVSQINAYAEDYEGGLTIQGSGTTGVITITETAAVDVSGFVGVSFTDKLVEVGLYIIADGLATFVTSYYQGNQAGNNQVMQFSLTRGFPAGTTLALGLAVDSGSVSANWVNASFKAKKAF